MNSEEGDTREGVHDETSAPRFMFERTINHTTMSVRDGVYVLYI